MVKQVKAMIISVGGSPGPVIFTLNGHRPQFVCFFASEQSVDKIWEIKSGLDFKFVDRKVLVSDPQDLLECYRKSLECVERVRREGYDNGDVLVDFTGGTKPMSGTLLSVSLAEGYNFVYVGGTERDKNSLGIVKAGTEMIIRGPNPWDLYAVEQRKKLCLFFNRYQFTACREITEEAIEHCRAGSTEEELFKGLKYAVDGYLEWDRFEHKKSRDLLNKGYRFLDMFARLTGNEKIKSFVTGIKNNLDYLNQFARETRGYKDLSRWQILDLLGNANRRFTEGKFDDAVARIYRALEMSAQWKLCSEYDINTSNVPLEKVPKEIRDIYQRKYLKGQVLQLPLAASFGLLSALGDHIGKTFQERQEKMDKILFTRNNSILAHGVQPVGAEPYQKFFTQVMDICNISESEIPVFPNLNV